MPAAIDLTGHRYGKLTVLARGDRVMWGRWQWAWRCRCDCGAEIDVPQRRLRASTARQRVDACSACRAHPCAVCGAPIEPPSTSATCSEVCRTIHRRAYWLGHYHKTMEADPEYSARRYAAALARRAADPEIDARMRASERAAKQRYAEKNPELLRALASDWYARNAERVQAERRARLEALSQEELEVWRERQRGYWRKNKSNFRESMRADPEMWEEYQENMKEYRRRRELAKMLGEAQALINRKETGDG